MKLAGRGFFKTSVREKKYSKVFAKEFRAVAVACWCGSWKVDLSEFLYLSRQLQQLTQQQYKNIFQWTGLMIFWLQSPRPSVHYWLIGFTATNSIHPWVEISHAKPGAGSWSSLHFQEAKNFLFTQFVTKMLMKDAELKQARNHMSVYRRRAKQTMKLNYWKMLAISVSNISWLKTWLRQSRQSGLDMA